jgi:hypothetical protein
MIPFDKTAAKIDPAVYDAYVGQYEIAADVILTITRDGDKLMRQVSGSKNKIELLPENEIAFFEKGRSGLTTFVKDDNGQVSHILQRSPDGQAVKFKKVK